MDFPFVVELLDYWLEYPPVHLLVRAFTGFKSERSNSWRAKRAQEIGDDSYRPERMPTVTENDAMVAREFTTGARHLDCAPPHIQQAIERAKKGEHLNIPHPE